MGAAVKYSIKGEHFLSMEDYSRGSDSFSKEVKENPDSPGANYYYGRFLRAEKKNRKTLQYLKKASALDSKSANYHFWVGVAYSSLGQKIEERKRYEKALSIKKDHLQALIYMGHNLLESKKYKPALEYYTKALVIWPTSPSSLYNRALILTKLGRKPEALDGWLEYLFSYPAGGMARQAVGYLNDLDDFSYRNHQLLTRTVTTEKIYFKSFSAEIDRGSYQSLDLVGTVFKNLRKNKHKRGKLQIIVYQLNNKQLAKDKALNLKGYLLKKFKGLEEKDIGVSWFDTAEKFKNSKGERKVNDSVIFFVSV